MPLIISDEELREARLDEREARIELACRLFDIGRLPLWTAARLAGFASQAPFEGELRARNIPIYRPTIEDLHEDMTTIEQLRARARR
jgi:predicted HTH domain antitoxin